MASHSRLSRIELANPMKVLLSCFETLVVARLMALILASLLAVKVKAANETDKAMLPALGLAEVFAAGVAAV